MTRRVDDTCPWCGQQPENYFEDLDSDDWEIIRPFRHDAESECRKGCAELSRAAFEFPCFCCGEWIAATCEYLQPCYANGVVLEMEWAKVERQAA